MAVSPAVFFVPGHLVGCDEALRGRGEVHHEEGVSADLKEMTWEVE